MSDAAPRTFVVRGNALLVYADDRMPVVDARTFDRSADPRERALGFVDLAASEFAIENAPEIGRRATRFVEPTFELGRYPNDVRAAVSRALALAKWAREMRFCPICARPLAWDGAGASRTCDNAPPHRHFPRTDPATIMLVTDGARALLGRQREWPEGMYSTLAGFCEPGESLEDCVAREVYEEAGIRVDDIRYFASQPWPFPQSLMVGYFARATTFDVRFGEEMDDVRWFTRDEVAALSVRLETRLPALDTIARRLIRAWLAATT